MRGSDLGQINPGLYNLAANPPSCASDFYDVTVGNNGAFRSGSPWVRSLDRLDPVTGLGTPNVGKKRC